MTPVAQRRLTQWIVWLLAALVVVLALVQILGVMDRLDLLIGSFAVLIAVVGVTASKGWLPTRHRR